MPYIAIVYVSTEHQARQIQQRYAGGDAGRIVGLYEMPAKGDSECPGGNCPAARHEKMFGWGRHKDKGYIVHGNCQRRRKGFRSRIRLVLLDTFGINLLPREATPALFRNPTNYDKPDAFPPIEPSTCSKCKQTGPTPTDIVHRINCRDYAKGKTTPIARIV